VLVVNQLIMKAKAFGDSYEIGKGVLSTRKQF